MTVNEPAVPTVKVMLLALVMAGAWFTVSVKFCVAAGADAVLRGERDGIIARSASRRSSGEHAGGSVERDARRQSAGLPTAPVRETPLAVTVNEPAVPTVKVVLLALVIEGATSTEFTTVSVKFCVASVELLKATIPAVQGAEVIVNPAATGPVAELN